MRNKLLSIVLSLGIVASSLFSMVYKVSAMPNIKPQEKPANLSVTQTAANNYDLQVGANVVHFGKPSVTSSFTAMTDFPDWQGYAWNADLNLTMGGKGLVLLVLDYPLLIWGTEMGVVSISWLIVPCIAMVILFARQFWVKPT